MPPRPTKRGEEPLANFLRTQRKLKQSKPSKWKTPPQKRGNLSLREFIEESKGNIISARNKSARNKSTRNKMLISRNKFVSSRIPPKARKTIVDQLKKYKRKRVPNLSKFPPELDIEREPKVRLPPIKTSHKKTKNRKKGKTNGNSKSIHYRISQPVPNSHKITDNAWKNLFKKNKKPPPGQTYNRFINQFLRSGNPSNLY